MKHLIQFLFLFLFFSLSAQTTKEIWLDEMDLSAMTSGYDMPRKNRSIEGWQKIKLGGQTFERGIGSHATSEYTIKLDGRAKRFESIVGVDDRAIVFKNVASVIFKVIIDNRVVFDSHVMKANDNPKAISIDLENAKILQLIIEDAADSQHGDQADWALAKITYRGEIPKPLYAIDPSDQYADVDVEEKKPSINGAQIYGARAGSPFLYRVPISGKRPVSISIEGLPKGLTFDPATGIINGQVSSKGRFRTSIIAKNRFGQDRRTFEIVIGDTILLTPLMGWNSWNAYGLKVNGKTVKKVADLFESTGLVDYGYSYINVDDGWQAKNRDALGKIQTNEKFPDMKGIADYLHNKGLKFGIYSSPGTKTCGGFLGSYQYEVQDADTYGEWGVDLLKYDWCSYDSISGGHTDIIQLKKPYFLMSKELGRQKRDIVYSLCQYGFGKVWEWGSSVGGNMWRTTDDIRDAWSTFQLNSQATIGLEDYASPGGWNDPDLLVVGKMGWGSTLRNTRLLKCEQYSQMTMQAMLSSPLILSCDLDSIDAFTLKLLKNRDVIAINQDKLGKQAILAKREGEVFVLKKPLLGNRVAISITNFGFIPKTISLDLLELGIPRSTNTWDVWGKNTVQTSKRIKASISGHESKLYIVKYQ